MAGGIRESHGEDDDDLALNHDINVTPFIDVMLVLLIIFMVAAPLSTVDVNVDLPASNAQSEPRPEEPIFVTLRDDLRVSIGNDERDRSEVGAALDAVTGGDKQARIFLRADQSVAYGDLMGLMNILRAAGYLKIGLVAMDATSAPPTASAAPTP